MSILTDEEIKSTLLGNRSDNIYQKAFGHFRSIGISYFKARRYAKDFARSLKREEKMLTADLADPEMRVLHEEVALAMRND
jgi:hypothetical protein